MMPWARMLPVSLMSVTMETFRPMTPFPPTENSKASAKSMWAVLWCSSTAGLSSMAYRALRASSLSRVRDSRSPVRLLQRNQSAPYDLLLFLCQLDLLDQHKAALETVEAAAILGLKDGARLAGQVLWIFEKEVAIGEGGFAGLRLVGWRTQDSDGAAGGKS